MPITKHNIVYVHMQIWYNYYMYQVCSLNYIGIITTLSNFTYLNWSNFSQVRFLFWKDKKPHVSKVKYKFKTHQSKDNLNIAAFKQKCASIVRVTVQHFVCSEAWI